MTQTDDVLAEKNREIAELRTQLVMLSAFGMNDMVVRLRQLEARAETAEAALLAEQVAKNVAWESYHLSVRRLEAELGAARALADQLYRELVYWKSRCGGPQPDSSIVVDISTGGRK